MVGIISDSTCDLSRELVEQYGITILPLYVNLGDEEYADGVDIKPQDLYKWSDQTKETPKTAAFSVADACKAYAEKLKEHDELIVFTISAPMSSCFNNARLAAAEFDEEKIHVIDSENLSTGIGLLVIEAAKMAQAGKKGDEIEQEILKLRSRVRASFIVDTLVYLHRGGRCSGLSAMVGGALKLHPRIEVKDGAMHPGKKYRGKIDHCVLRYAKDMEEDLRKAKKDRVFVTHSGCDDSIVQPVIQYLKDLAVFDEILVTQAGSVVSSHCGPGTLGVLFIAGQ